MLESRKRMRWLHPLDNGELRYCNHGSHVIRSEKGSNEATLGSTETVGTGRNDNCQVHTTR
jgi:hypothetical protein